MLEGEAGRLLEMEEILGRRVVGQDAALKSVSDAVRRSRSGLADPDRPVGSFIFMGPTGVGKTELARALAEFLFDDEQAMVRIDMSEYQEKHAVARLIGAPPGYVGFEEGGQLTEAVRRRPYAVILFDEIEKAHPEVFNVMLQVLDDGRLTDGQGRTVDFRHAVIIMTSNVGSEYIQEYATDYEKMKDLVMEAMHQRFKPEFLNRIDEFVIFHSLDMARIKEVVGIQMKRLEERLRGKKLRIEISESARELLAREGYQPAFGARPLKRVIQRLVQDPLARRIIAGEVAEGAMIGVDSDGEKMIFSVDPAPQ
jgi:ATP-dependent Clp protease ATP-binding subunit ClpB